MEQSTVLQDISGQVTCGICLEHFKIPKTVIPCLHNFCEDCLESTIETTAQPKISKLPDPRISAIFTFPCPSCRGPVEFPVRITQPWNMKQIANDAVKKEFKTNFQIENQIDIINKKIEKGCQQHQGEVRMWYCKVCNTIICQFCIQEAHLPPNHEVKLLNVIANEKRQRISTQKEAVTQRSLDLEGRCATMESYLEAIHTTRSKYENQQKLFIDELRKARKELDTLENNILTQGQNFNEELTSNEVMILKVYQDNSIDVEDCKTQINELDKKLCDTDLDIVESSMESKFQESAARTAESTSMPTLQIPQSPSVPLELLRQGVLEMKNIIKDITCDLQLSTTATASTGSSAENQQVLLRFQQPSGERRSRDTKNVIDVSLKGPEVTLNKSKNPWKPRIRRKVENASEEGDKTENLIKKFKSILNKLTLQNFQTLMARTLALPIDNEERLTVIVDLVYEKAISEPTYSKAYANMCRVLSQIKVPAANATGIVQFRTVLINRCQHTFEVEKKEEATWAEMKKEIEQMKAVGNIRFIGELFKLRMLSENTVHDCIFKLLRAKDDKSLECASQLLTTVGKDLDHERAKNRMNQYFTHITKIISDKKISARTRLVLQDVQDLRKRNWVPRRDDNNPKTIAQIHQEAKQEEKQKKIETQMAFHASKSRGKRSGGQGGRFAPPEPSSDWQTVAVSNKGRPTIHPTKLINLDKNRSNDDDDVQLIGPGGQHSSFGSWRRGSSAACAKMHPPDQIDLMPAGNNRYAIVSRQGKGTRPGMAPPTRDSKGRPTGSIPSRRSRERDDGRGSSREDRRQRERMQLLDEVQKTMSGARSRSTEEDRISSRDSGVAMAKFLLPVGKSAVASYAATHLSDEEFERTCRAILDEYLTIRDFRKACYCLSELNSPDRMHLFVRLSVEHALEMNAKSRIDTGALFHRLIKDNLLSVQQYLQGLNEILEFADDMAIDIPRIWEYLGEIMGSIIQDKSQSLDYLSKALEPVKVAGKAGVLLAEILKMAEKNIGVEDLNDLWQATGLNWAQFLPDGENVTEFVNNKKLEYTLQESRGHGDLLAKMTNELGFILASENCDNETLFSWIKKNTNPDQIKQRDFIRALVTALCQSTMKGDSSRCDPELLKVRAKWLLRYIDGDVDRELQALYAAQALNHKLVNPPGFLRLIFDVLYDEDVISEETFYAWQNSSDPAEQAGKGVALKSISSFFAWLGEAEEEVVS